MQIPPFTRRLARTLLPFLASAVGAGLAAAQTTWFVDDDAPNDPGKGTPASSDPLENGSSAHPFDALSEAIAAAASGDTILVRPSNPEHTGLHYHEFSTVDLSGPGAAKILTIQSTNGPAVTVFQGLSGSPFDVELFRADSGETPAFVFQGFTLRGANNGSSSSDIGGALKCVNSSPTIRDCRFESNHAYVGGGIYLSGSNSLVEDCTFSANSAVHQGGAVYTDNSSPTVSRCFFVGNSANFGGAWLTRTISSGAPRVLDCTFLQNEALTGYGGAMAKFDGGTITVERTRFVSNGAATDGGGLLVSGSGQVWDCTFHSNSAVRGGGLFFGAGGGTKTAFNSTLTNNSGGGVVEDSGVIAGELRNCIVWGNLGVQVGSNVSVQHCDVMGGYGGTGNLDVDPLFVNPLGLDGIPGTLDDDLSLMRESPCIDAGNTLVLTTRSPHVDYPLDLAGNPRASDSVFAVDTGIAVVGLTVDLGAFELVPLTWAQARPVAR